ncbi:MAG: hypothetical protein COX65_07805 [Elusimicrobia bacterium CG_4_10_14_0_2_um_filter_56_8]|nr:MAG: hypothetical protein AUJ51_11995 [Elusimicrobia bacterium CG1_02_56_21]PJA13006.1 MAG: hypothetical protein COX65_07805 [Elusimicrobia bacterium CG_4_10_14_0_2_um_filter_56_8]
MKKIIITAVCGLFAASASAAENLNFTDAAFLKQANSIASAPAVEVPAAKPVRAKAGHYVQVSGYVNLNGNGWVPGTTGGFTSVTLTGWANFRDSSGKVTSNNSYLNVNASMWIYPNQHVYQTVWPNVYVQFYRNGKPVGSTNMSGSISVSGWPSSNFVSLSGSGYMNGSIYVEDEE